MLFNLKNYYEISKALKDIDGIGRRQDMLEMNQDALEMRQDALEKTMKGKKAKSDSRAVIRRKKIALRQAQIKKDFYQRGFPVSVIALEHGVSEATVYNDLRTKGRY